jgi:hypothetical protein
MFHGYEQAVAPIHEFCERVIVSFNRMYVSHSVDDLDRNAGLIVR